MELYKAYTLFQAETDSSFSLFDTHFCSFDYQITDHRSQQVPKLLQLKNPNNLPTNASKKDNVL